MNLFLDTSALMKLYVAEPNSSTVRRWVDEAEIVSACRIAWAEFMAAVAARVRVRPQPPTDIDARAALRRDWPSIAKVEVSQPLVERAGELATMFGLRGYDSVQLAAAERLHLGSPIPVVFGCFDQRLSAAAQSMGIALPAPD